MDISISALISAVPGLAKLAGEIAGAANEAKRNALLIDFQKQAIQFNSTLAAIQAENHTLLEAKRGLERQIVQMKNWEAEKARYQLHAVASGGVVYALKESMSGGEPAHFLCANCYQQGKKSILNPRRSERNEMGTQIGCPSCDASLPTGYRGGFSAQYAP